MFSGVLHPHFLWTPNIVFVVVVLVVMWYYKMLKESSNTIQIRNVTNWIQQLKSDQCCYCVSITPNKTGDETRPHHPAACWEKESEREGRAALWDHRICRNILLWLSNKGKIVKQSSFYHFHSYFFVLRFTWQASVRVCFNDVLCMGMFLWKLEMHRKFSHRKFSTKNGQKMHLRFSAKRLLTPKQQGRNRMLWWRKQKPQPARACLD